MHVHWELLKTISLIQVRRKSFSQKSFNEWTYITVIYIVHCNKEVCVVHKILSTPVVVCITCANLNCVRIVT